ncbi:MAG: DinB family protein [Bacteroidetes bacterium]|nr:DinB family protein [Bacteroidota bacterium]
MTTATTTQQELFVLSGLITWEQAIKRATALFDGLSDEDLNKEIVPGKNRVVYLLGHLTAVHDRMLPLLGLGERLYPHLDELFVTNPDNPAASFPPASQLREFWTTVNQQLTSRFRSWTPEEWLQKHTAVSDEDFAKEPHRNRFSLVINRAGHIQYHLGQLAWAKK